jgi:hypothetical protein
MAKRVEAKFARIANSNLLTITTALMTAGNKNNTTAVRVPRCG